MYGLAKTPKRCNLGHKLRAELPFEEVENERQLGWRVSHPGIQTESNSYAE